MVSRRRLSNAVRQFVRERASGLCEYCHTSETWQYVRFTIDHILPLAQGGSDDSDNLALACFHCNRHKAGHTTGHDPVTDEACALFHPRQMAWQEHFVWSQNTDEIIGLTPTGRATLARLDLNRPRIRTIRLADAAIGRHPPPSDPIQAAKK